MFRTMQFDGRNMTRTFSHVPDNAYWCPEYDQGKKILSVIVPIMSGIVPALSGIVPTMSGIVPMMSRIVPV